MRGIYIGCLEVVSSLHFWRERTYMDQPSPQLSLNDVCIPHLDYTLRMRLFIWIEEFPIGTL